jgi:hypothetical protein
MVKYTELLQRDGVFRKLYDRQTFIISEERPANLIS